MNHTIIIAEIGECFNGEIQTAERLMTAAKEAGCDIVKFQTLDYENIADDDPEGDWFKKVALDPEKIEYFIKYSKKLDIDILFTPENIKTCKWLLDAGLKNVKIASSSMADIELFQFIKDNFSKIYLSTGMASLDEVVKAVSFFKNADELYIMHCISEYPCGPLLDKYGLRALSNENVRLNMMKMLMYLFPNYKVGYSDHTDQILAPVAAVAAGAKIIEKHITLDRKKPVDNFNNNKEYLGTDHVLSLEPDELKEMVRQIREVEKMFGDWQWERTEGEKYMLHFLRGRFSGDWSMENYETLTKNEK